VSEQNGGGVGAGIAVAGFLGRLGAMWDGLDGQRQERVLRGMLQFLENPVDSPVVKKLVGSKGPATSAQTYSFIDLGAPPGGKIWDVRRVGVWGTATDSFTAVPSAIAEIGIFPAVPSDGPTAPALEHLVTVATAANIPYAPTWLRGQLTLYASEHLVVIIKSIGNNVNVGAAAQALEWDESQRSSWESP